MAGDRRGARRQAHRHHRVHRVRRHGPGRAAAARGARVRAGAARARRQAHDRRRRVQREISRTTPSTACAPSSAGRPSVRRDDAARITTIAGDVGTDGLGLDDDRPGPCSRVRHRHPLRGRGVVRLPARLGGRDQPARARRASPSCSTSSASRRTSSRCRRATSPATVAAGRPRSSSARAVRHRPELAQRGRRGPPAARRRRGGEPPARAARRVPLARPAPSSAPPARRRWPPRPSSCASGGCSDRLVEAGRARAASVGWPDAYAFTKALGEQALTETKGDVPGQHRPPVDHRVGAGPSRARVGSAASAWPSR